MGTPQELKLSTAYKTVRRKFYQSIFKWFADDTVNEEVSDYNYSALVYTFRVLYSNFYHIHRLVFDMNILNIYTKNAKWYILHLRECYSMFSWHYRYEISKALNLRFSKLCSIVTSYKSVEPLFLWYSYTMIIQISAENTFIIWMNT
jgi:hypothetical protein